MCFTDDYIPITCTEIKLLGEKKTKEFIVNKGKLLNSLKLIR